MQNLYRKCFWALSSVLDTSNKRIINKTRLLPLKTTQTSCGYLSSFRRSSRLGWKNCHSREIWNSFRHAAINLKHGLDQSHICNGFFHGAETEVRKGGWGLQDWVCHDHSWKNVMLCWGAGNIEKDESIIGCNYHRDYRNSSSGILRMLPTGWIMSWQRTCILWIIGAWLLKSIGHCNED